MSDIHIKTDQSPARIIQITDTHIGADKSFLFNDTDTLASLARVIDAIRENDQPDLVLATGDLAHEPVSTAYAMLLEQLFRLEVPVFCLPGNHDDPMTMEQVLNERNVTTQKHLWVNDWLVLLLNSFVPGTHAGQLAEPELEWLDEQLACNLQDPVLIAVHHPPVSINSPWMDSMMLRNHKDFFSLIDRYEAVRAVIWGHIHQQFQSQRNDVQLWGTPSTSIQFRPGSTVFQEDDLPSGYRVLDLSEKGCITSHVVRISS